MSGHIAKRVERLLLMKSGGRCAFRTCGKSLVLNNPDGTQVTVGQLAHVRGEKEGSARYDAGQSEAERNGEANIMLMCDVHHTQIDKAADAWTVDVLLAMKREHEEAVEEGLKIALAKVNFEELEKVVGGLLSAKPVTIAGFQVVLPEEKMAKNGLSDATGHYLVLGLSRAGAVQAYVQSQEANAPGFARRLSAGFLARYHLSISKGVSGDDLFFDLVEFSTALGPDLRFRAAGLAVLSYLFTACEVFEK